MSKSFSIALFSAAAAVLSPHASAAEWPSFLDAVSGRVIVAISDGDFVASTYRDGVLASEAAGHRDLLTVIDLSAGGPSSSALEVSNSVTAAPEILQLSPNGDTAYVVERLGQRAPGQTTVKELAPGSRLFAIDLSSPAKPRLAATAEIAAFPESLSVSPDGVSIAAVSNTPEASILTIVPYENGTFGPPKAFDLATLGVTGTSAAPRGGVSATNVHWHPSGRFLAVNINTQNRVAFFEVVGSGDALDVRPWGEPVEVGADPFTGRFTPDGRHYLTANWGRNFAASDLEGRLPRTASEVAVVRLADIESASAEARHERIGSASSDLSSEGIAIHPDGTLVATVNMRGTALAPGSRRFDRQASVTLFRFDAASGELTKAADYPLDGVLPEGGAFDASGDHFLATVFEGHPGAGADKGAGLEVFRVMDGDAPSLEALGRIALPHGAHHVAIAR